MPGQQAVAKQHLTNLKPTKPVEPESAQFFQRQTQVLNRVLDGMEGKLTNAKWASIGKCSADTALRDINDLLARGVLRRLEGGGRSTGYALIGWIGKD